MLAQKCSVVVRVSGCHGVGKTTLIRGVASCVNGAVLDRLDLAQSPSLSRQMRNNLARHLRESRRERFLLRNRQGPVGLQDRCIYDWIAYLRAYESLGALGAIEVADLRSHYESAISLMQLPALIVFLDAPSDWIIDKLARRAAVDPSKPLDVYTPKLTRAVAPELRRAFLEQAVSLGAKVLHVTTLDHAGRLVEVSSWLHTQVGEVMR